MQGWAIPSVKWLPSSHPAIHEAQQSNEAPNEEKNASSGGMHNPRYTSNRLDNQGQPLSPSAKRLTSQRNRRQIRMFSETSSCSAGLRVELRQVPPG
ncbi:hypothetical protein MKX08_002177 [Trichoderma sp. CBMAI-0020]|nr:hypothetical protein MKX08_002177 [Trichoderma sp. CBMAI-0020]WOD46522.1 hypothetical protein [Trichoderma atroviride]